MLITTCANAHVALRRGPADNTRHRSRTNEIGDRSIAREPQPESCGFCESNPGPVLRCFKTAAQCAFGREKFVAAKFRYTGCLPQARASCFAFVSVLQASDSFDCSATIEACQRQRAHAIGRTADVRDVADCTPWE